MKFRWSEWLTAVALVLGFSAFAGAEAPEPTTVPPAQAHNLATVTTDSH